MTMTMMMIFCSALFLLFLSLFLSGVDACCRSCSSQEVSLDHVKDLLHPVLKEIAANVQPVLPSWLLAFLLLVLFFAWISFTGYLAAFWNRLVRLDKNNYPKCRWILEVVSWLDDKFSWFKPENLNDNARKAEEDLAAYRATNAAQASVIEAQASLIAALLRSNVDPRTLAAVERERDALRETLRLTERRLMAAEPMPGDAMKAVAATREKVDVALAELKKANAERASLLAKENARNP